MTDRLHEIGIPKSRAATLFNVAEAVSSGALSLVPTCDTAEIEKQFKKLKGIGDWTASYVALRALGDPDAFPEGDLDLQKAGAPDKERLTPKQLLALAENWRPWRGYAALHL